MAIGDQFQKNIPSSKLSDLYKNRFRFHVFSLLKMGYDRIAQRNYQNSEETIITEELVEAIKKVLEGPSSPPWAGRYSIHEDPKLGGPGRHGKRRPMVDIQFEFVRRGSRPRYEFEAKRLSAGKRGISQYLGNDGLGCFLDGKYARNAGEAGMLGYVQLHAQDDWQKKIKQRLDNNPKGFNVCAGGEWASVTIVPQFDHCYRSGHNRPALGKPITIYHALLFFC